MSDDDKDSDTIRDAEPPSRDANEPRRDEPIREEPSGESEIAPHARTKDPTPPSLDPNDLDALPPRSISLAVDRVSRRIHRWLATDAAMAGLGLGLLTAAPVGLGLHLSEIALWPAAALGAVVGMVFGAMQFRGRRLDPVRAARVLDRMIDAKDRLASAVQFAATAKGASETSPLHRLQMKEAAEFLAAVPSIPEPPRPIARAPRWVAAGVFAMAATVPLAYAWPELSRAVAESLGEEPEPRTAEEIADEAEALR
ncbi:MAG: hypothetical protein J0L92_13325, partial [Deltaproteobacteria bacterium]|nr:hypothetical protein [Deltaproteobacteria bacterium]